MRKLTHNILCENCNSVIAKKGTDFPFGSTQVPCYNCNKYEITVIMIKGKDSFTEKIKNDWYLLNLPTGRKLGYPECCIKEFGNQPPQILKLSKPTQDDIMRYNAGCVNGKFTGFIPCIEHAKQITNGEIKLEDLINLEKRDSLLPKFPNA